MQAQCRCLERVGGQRRRCLQPCRCPRARGRVRRRGLRLVRRAGGVWTCVRCCRRQWLRRFMVRLHVRRCCVVPCACRLTRSHRGSSVGRIGSSVGRIGGSVNRIGDAFAPAATGTERRGCGWECARFYAATVDGSHGGAAHVEAGSDGGADGTATASAGAAGAHCAKNAQQRLKIERKRARRALGLPAMACRQSLMPAHRRTRTDTQPHLRRRALPNVDSDAGSSFGRACGACVHYMGVARLCSESVWPHAGPAKKRSQGAWRPGIPRSKRARRSYSEPMAQCVSEDLLRHELASGNYSVRTSSGAMATSVHAVVCVSLRLLRRCLPTVPLRTAPPRFATRLVMRCMLEMGTAPASLRLWHWMRGSTRCAFATQVSGGEPSRVMPVLNSWCCRHGGLGCRVYAPDWRGGEGLLQGGAEGAPAAHAGPTPAPPLAQALQALMRPLHRPS